MSLAREYIEKIKRSAEKALEDIDNKDYQRVLGDLDCVEHDCEAAKILTKEEKKELKAKRR